MRDNLSQRPRIDVPKTPWDYVADVFAVAGVLLGVALLIVTWADIPDQVPRVFLPSGEPTAWADRWTVTVPIGVAIVTYVGLRLLTRIPHYFNYPWPITQDNAAIQYQISRSMIFWMNAIVVWMFLLIVWSQIRVALGASDGLLTVLIIGSLILIHVVMAVFLYRAHQNRHGERREDQTYWNQT